MLTPSATITKTMRIFLVAAVLSLTILAQAWGAPGQHYLIETEDAGNNKDYCSYCYTMDYAMPLPTKSTNYSLPPTKILCLCLKLELLVCPGEDGDKLLPTVMPPTKTIL